MERATLISYFALKIVLVTVLWVTENQHLINQEYGMNTFIVTLESTVEDLIGYRYYFTCEAEDAEHAGEQAEDAYPSDIIIDVELNGGFGL